LVGWELLRLMEDYSQGLVPLIVPLTPLKRHLNRHAVPDWVLMASAAWEHQKAYLHSYPNELMLRNHV
jgi:uncharacterized protein YbgA (DUF1722 family)